MGAESKKIRTIVVLIILLSGITGKGKAMVNNNATFTTYNQNCLVMDNYPQPAGNNLHLARFHHGVCWNNFTIGRDNRELTKLPDFYNAAEGLFLKGNYIVLRNWKLPNHPFYSLPPALRAPPLL